MARYTTAGLLTLLMTLGNTARAQDEDPDDLIPGLLATYSAPDCPTIRRIDHALRWDWSDAAPDVRLPTRGFRVRWTGLLLVQSPGRHRFAGRTDGTLRLTVAGRVALEGSGDSLKATEVDLPGGLTPMEVTYSHDAGQARVAIDWEGPGFHSEPLPSRLLFHGKAADEPSDRFEQGRRLADRLGCANCHVISGLIPHPNLGPPLAEAASSIRPAYLHRWLADPIAVRPATPMPAFGHRLDPGEAADLAAFLGSLSGKGKAAPITNEVQMAMNLADPARGRILFHSVGCLGCHSRGKDTNSTLLPTAPDLADLARKRPAARVAALLARPKADTVGRHRPDLRLTADEAAHLSTYLVAEEVENPEPAQQPTGNAERGRILADRLRCASCHAIPGLSPRPPERPLRAGSNPAAGCLADEPRPGVPRFALDPSGREALRAFVAGLPSKPSPIDRQTLALDVIRRRNCLGCHARDGQGGEQLGTRLAAALAKDSDLNALKGTLTPPNLSAVGAKLRPEYLALAVRGAAPTARPWLSVRMPVYPFEAGEADSLTAFLHAQDRQIDSAEPPERTSDAHALEAAGELVGRKGFGCVSCHVIGGKIPPGGEPETLGPDLALARRRMTERYFRRWLANPQRIIPGTPMPQFVQPVPVHPGTLDDQLRLIWSGLSSPRVGEIASQGTREILKRQGDRALVVRDMILVPGLPDTEYTPRGLAIGLKNGQSLLFDTDRLTWLAWWRGGFAYRTKSGRLWEWHPDGERLWTAPDRQPPIVFLKDGKVILPTEVRERFGSFSEVLFVGDQLSLEYDLNGPESSKIRVRETLVPLGEGWRRDVEVSGVPPGYRPALLERLPGSKAEESTWTWAVGPSRWMLKSSESASVGSTPTLIPMAIQESGAYRGRLEFQPARTGSAPMP